jgi:hypothetical protein
MPYRAAPLTDDDATDRLDCVEVTARWGDELLAVAHLRPGERFTLGALALPDVDDDWALAEHGVDGRAVAHRHPRAEGEAGRALGRSESHAQTLGEVTLVVRRTWGMEPAARRWVDPRARVVLAMVGALLAMVVVGAMGLRGATRGRAALDEGEDDRRVLLALMARWPRSIDAAHEAASPRPVSPPRWESARRDTPTSVGRYSIARRPDRRVFRLPRRGRSAGAQHDDPIVACASRARGCALRSWHVDAELDRALRPVLGRPRWQTLHAIIVVHVGADGVLRASEAVSSGSEVEQAIRAVGRVRLPPTRGEHVSTCCLNMPCELPE